ncbi:hypothetical protein MXD62_30635 [Frankia sp. Mgl5]|uniref:hypothetical protein n=1 Tax=Frankia sp. Mgl5 TaxID=2933793 RepID=UPI00200E048E|nr:hypothetical protein [Frankia sp. Mgl5]MCK9931441.1 hypothetical protein [Frankia sp. Mgl5]
MGSARAPRGGVVAASYCARGDGFDAEIDETMTTAPPPFICMCGTAVRIARTACPMPRCFTGCFAR